jgi:putative hydrolase of HD superfamily
MKLKKIINFIFELGMLKRIKHEGWRVAGVERPESVGEHSLRAAQIAYILAHMEGYSNPDEVCSMLVFHDIGECRIGDIHKIANNYIQADEKRAILNQTSDLDRIGDCIFDKWSQFENKNTEAGKIAKDADLLEQAFTAKEYLEKGYVTQNWIDNVNSLLQTNSAKNLIETLIKAKSSDWWVGLKKVD